VVSSSVVKRRHILGTNCRHISLLEFISHSCNLSCRTQFNSLQCVLISCGLRDVSEIEVVNLFPDSGYCWLSYSGAKLISRFWLLLVLLFISLS